MNTPATIQSLLPQGIVRTSRAIPVPLAAGAIVRLPYAGVRFYIVSSTRTQVGIGIKTDKTTEEIFYKGTGKEFTEDQFFTALEVRNTSATLAVTIVLFAGFGNYIDNRLNVVSVDEGLYLPVMEGRSRIASRALQTLGILGTPNDHVDLDGVTPIAAPPVGYTDVKRQSIVITNNDLALWLEVMDAAGNVGARVLAGKQIILPASEFVRINEPTGTVVSCQIMEIWTCIKL